MGKRELVIAAAIVLIGFVVYQVTAPPADPSTTGFSFGKIVNEIRREIRGQNASAETTFTATREVPETISEIRLSFAVGGITIVGEDREDVEAEMHVRSTGFDTEEAEKLAKASHVVFDEAGALMIISGKFPVEGRQTPTLRLKVPRRLGIRIDEKGSSLTVSNVASVLVGTGRGSTTISGIEGSVNVTQRGSEVTVTNVGSLKLSTVTGTEAVVASVRGDATFNLQGGDLRAEDIRGAIEVEARNAEMEFSELATKGPIRINAMLGEIVLNGLAADTRIDGRRSEIRIEHAGGAPLAVHNEGDETIELTVPSGGFTLDALAVDGQISVDDGLESLGLKREASGNGDGNTDRGSARQEVRVTGAVRGGGPPITLRATRGDIVVRGR